ncbi:3-hydroxybutyryl-CoA dehydrogenase [Alicyclobacillus cycloheptanicus]|uniref:3-hydroxybutyryl-CoA dehydrogenase n=1 Tax=Alicyclobacillus cycloheptanicus TaxID=1457 RepID=A0ABT9XED8_9BACL|nr:3-hydroxybutyryl-CoA dehydrogenase [Alicyclobacillus cycloheptanicus]MDQ0188647.1 3-hydroxybutyryl-CoA dehydrogenase [Alicyclobacillus cycloheptanicus]WDM00678.1 3-hydroxybutyryl-CoA dehydrogenase [Alicyclobacillus cycloheptanicus]
MEIHQIGVVGAGTMGAGIAQTAAAAGYQVLLFDISADAVERALTQITNRLAHEVRRDRMTQEASDALLRRLRPCRDIREFHNAQYVIEAATEKMEVKKSLFRELDQVCRPETVLATNTSGLSITEIASATERPDLVVGTHFFNPVPVMKLVEIIRGQETSEDAVDVAREVCLRMGKECIDVKEAPLFVVNRILVPMLNEAIFVLQEGLASPEDIDKGMRLGANHPIGPLALADMVGLDTLLFVAETLFEETGDPKYRPAPLLRQMVRAGKLGRKNGRGFYTYDEA